MHIPAWLNFSFPYSTKELSQRTAFMLEVTFILKARNAENRHNFSIFCDFYQIFNQHGHQLDATYIWFQTEYKQSVLVIFKFNHWRSFSFVRFVSNFVGGRLYSNQVDTPSLNLICKKLKKYHCNIPLYIHEPYSSYSSHF